MVDGNLQGVMKEFGKDIDLPELSFDDAGYCCLSFDEIVVNLEVDEPSGHLFFYSNVGNLPEEGRAEFYEILLEANFLYRETAGGILGIDKELNGVVLAYKVPFSGLDLPQFSRVMGNFIGMVELWTERIQRAAHGQEQERSSVDPYPKGIRA